jgi:hypothetical protein
MKSRRANKPLETMMKIATLLSAAATVACIAASGPAWAGCVITESGEQVCQQQNFYFYNPLTKIQQVKKGDPDLKSNYLESINNLGPPTSTSNLGSSTVYNYNDSDIRKKIVTASGIIKYKFKDGTEFRLLGDGQSYVTFGSNGSVTGSGSLGGTMGR